MDEIAASKTLDTVDEADIEEDDSESDDETDTNEPDHLDLIDDKKDMIYDDDVAYEPIEEGNKSDSEVTWIFSKIYFICFFWISLFESFWPQSWPVSDFFFFLANLLFIS